MQSTMRCVVESIFSGTKRKFGDYLFSVKDKFRGVEVWLRTILWNVLIYPREKTDYTKHPLTETI